jgi:hypothetical protein
MRVNSLKDNKNAKKILSKALKSNKNMVVL